MSTPPSADTTGAGDVQADGDGKAPGAADDHQGECEWPQPGWGESEDGRARPSTPG